MIVNHEKVSGEANPTDPAKVGGEDWDAPHVIVGPVVAGTGQYDFGSGGSLSVANSNGLDFVRTGVGTYRSTLPSAEVWFMVFARAVDGSNVHHDVDVAFVYEPGVAYVDLTVKTRAGTVVDLTTGSLWIFAIDHGLAL